MHPLIHRCALSLALLTPLWGTGAAQASQITLHTRASSAAAPNLGSDAANGNFYRSLLAGLVAAPAGGGYCDTVLSSLSGLNNQGACAGGSGTQIAFEIDIGFSLASGGDFSVQLAPDFGLGGALFVDGQLLAVKTDDLWWGGNFGATGELLSFSHLLLGSGDHQLQLVGLEGCCDGSQGGRFQLNGGAWTNFGASDGLASPQVPEPNALALAVAALVAAAALSRRRARR